MNYRIIHFGSHGFPLIATSNVNDTPFFTAPDGVEQFRKALWSNFKEVTSLGQLDKARAEIMFYLLFLKEEDTIDPVAQYGKRNDELIAVIRKASAHFKQKFAPPADQTQRPWTLTREQFYTLPHTLSWGRGKKKQWVKVYTDPSGKVTRHFPNFYEDREIVDNMYHRCLRWAYERGMQDLIDS